MHLTSLPILLPSFTAAAVPPLAIEAPATALATNIAINNIATAARPDRPRSTLARREARRLTETADIAPALRDRQAGTIMMAALPPIEPDGSAVPSRLVRSQTAYREVALWRDALLDHLLP